METIEFEGSSRLKKIGERAFSGCRLRSITIPVLTEEIDGSSFCGCPLISIQVAPENVNFKIEGNRLVTSDGTELVRYFGIDREIFVGKNVRVLGKSCLEGCRDIVGIEFESGSALQRIRRSALRDCASLSSIEIPASVEGIEEASFEGCTELQSCVMDRNSSLITIGSRAFAKCASLRSFDVPTEVGEIGSNCFSNCIYLYQLKFRSSESLKRVVGDRPLDDALAEFGVRVDSGLFRIDIEGGELQ
jgi:hypothetical protein